MTIFTLDEDQDVFEFGRVWAFVNTRGSNPFSSADLAWENAES